MKACASWSINKDNTSRPSKQVLLEWFLKPVVIYVSFIKKYYLYLYKPTIYFNLQVRDDAIIPWSYESDEITLNISNSPTHTLITSLYLRRTLRDLFVNVTTRPPFWPIGSRHFHTPPIYKQFGRFRRHSLFRICYVIKWETKSNFASG